MTTTALIGGSAFRGMRPVNLRADLSGMTDLVELCFGPTMDETGRAAIREMRMMAQSSAFWMLFRAVNSVVSDLERGFVWIEDGRLIGNVSVAPGHYPQDMGKGFVIANVAVHPDFRRRGLAKRMLAASLDLIREQEGAFAVLQVDASNHGARQLYTSFGFVEERTFVDWRRPWHVRPPARFVPMPFMTLRQGNEWRDEFELAQMVRPNARGGLGWLRPTHPDLFRPSLRRVILNGILGKTEEQWIIRHPNGQGIAASMRAMRSFGGADRLEMLVHPSQQGQLELPLLNYALRRLADRFHPTAIEHPEDDEAATAALESNQFERRFTTVHMRYDFKK